MSDRIRTSHGRDLPVRHDPRGPLDLAPAPIPAPRPASEAEPAHLLQDLYTAVIREVDPDPQREGLMRTPDRAASALRELTSGYHEDPASLFTTFESDGYDEMVLVRAIPFYSLCEHHLLPFHGQAHIAYIPQGRIVGLSKLARLVEVFARRLQVQERLTAQVADTLVEHLDPAGVIVVVEAEHLCMTMRGVQKPGSTTLTSAVRGALKDKPEARAEALALIGRRDP